MLVEPINWDIGPTFNVRKMLLGIGMYAHSKASEAVFAPETYI